MATEQDPSNSWHKRIKWAVIIFFISADMAAVQSIGPSMTSFFDDILARNTDCAKIGDCDARAAKFGGFSGSLRSFFVVVLAAPYGVLADRYGRRPLLIAASFRILMTYPFLIGKPSSIMPFFVMNALVGLMPVASNVMSIMIVDLTSPSDRLKYMGYQQVAILIIMLISTSAGSLFVYVLGPQALLLISIVMTIIEVIVLIFLLPETAPLEQNDSAAEKKTVEDPSSPKSEEPPKLRRMTSKNMADVLFRGKDIDDDHRWEAKAFWLFLLCEIPDQMLISVLPYLVHDLFGLTPAEFGMFGTSVIIYSFLWMFVGTMLLNYIFDEDARILQVVVGISLLGDVLVLCSTWHYAPFLAVSFASANGLVPIALKTIILNATAEHRQGKVMGFLNAADAICHVVAPAAGGLLLSSATEFGIPRVPWILMCCLSKPLCFGLTSFTMLPECMPPNLKKRAAAGKRQKKMSSKGASSLEQHMLGI